MQYFATTSFSQNQDSLKDQIFKLVCIGIFILSPIALWAQTTPQELQECESILLRQLPEDALQCLNEKRPTKLEPNSRISLVWLELWLEAKLKNPNQKAPRDSKQHKEAINLAIQFLGSPALEANSKERLSNLVYQHLNSKAFNPTENFFQAKNNHLLLAFMVLVSCCILCALFIVNRHYLKKNKDLNSPRQEHKVLQHHVKERNQALIQQYSRLQDYSIANSHLVRAPLARLLGLVELLKDEPLTRDGKFYLQHIAQSCEELDEWVMKMNAILDPENTSSDDAEKLSSLNHFLSIEK